MGLAVAVGALADLKKNNEEGAEWLRKSFEEANQVLVSEGVAPNYEPETVPPLRFRSSLDGYPYSFLHYLRRIYARLADNPKWKPVPCGEDEDPSEDAIVDSQCTLFNSHLLCHSDAE